jgi:hypothetical protein
MVKDRDYLKVATMAIPTGFLQERNLRYMEHRVGLGLTCFDTLTHSDAEILALVASLPFEFADPPMWRPYDDTVPLENRVVLAAATHMDVILWAHLGQIILNTNGVCYAIHQRDHTAEDQLTFSVQGEMTSYVRSNFGPAAFP